MMKALSLWQPWGTAMDRAQKGNETRSWSTTYRGDLLICASKRPPKGDDEFGETEAAIYAAAVNPNDGAPYSPEQMSPPNGVQWRTCWGQQLPFGAALCVVELYDVVPTWCLRFTSSDHPRESKLGNYEPGRFAWKTRNLRRLARPMPFKGAQGLRAVEAVIERRIREQLVMTCQFCGCIQTHACPGGCAWIRSGSFPICSALTCSRRAPI